MTVTIDASVWVAARFENEPAHVVSALLLRRVLATREPIVLPWLAWIECVAAVARKTGDSKLADDIGNLLLSRKGIHWSPLDEAHATEATSIAASCRLRAADAVYVASARRRQATLITLDRELRERSEDVVACFTPDEWLRELDENPDP